MNVENRLKLSYYHEVAAVSPRHGVKLVQHTETGKIYVEKMLEVYNPSVYQFLASHQISGIPHIQELIEDEHALYLIEEYISGDTLRERLNRNELFSPEAATDVLRQLCAILRPLHQQIPPMIHRDIKPENLILTSEGKLYLVDFNAAKEASPDTTRDTMLFGTSGYAAPEQYGFSQSMPCTDIYAIGVLLNELLTGHLPQSGIFPGWLGDVVRKCTELDYRNRFQSVDDLLLALDSGYVGKPPLLAVLKAWLPPGFRGKELWVKLVALLWYLVFTALSITLKVDNPTTPTQLLLTRIGTWLFFLLETLWLGNYRHIWGAMPFSSNQKLPIKIIGVALWAVVLPVALLFVLVMLLDIVK